MPGTPLAPTRTMALSEQNYIGIVKKFLAGSENEALQEITLGNQIQGNLLYARRLRRNGSFEQALEALNQIAPLVKCDFYKAEVFDQMAQIYRHLDHKKSYDLFLNASLHFRTANYIERALESESNALSISENFLTTGERYKEWSQLYKKSTDYPIASMGILLSLYACAIEANAPDQQLLAKEFESLIKHNINQQDRIVYHLIKGEEAFRNGSLSELKNESEMAEKVFLETPVNWLKTRIDLLRVRRLYIEGQGAKGHALLFLIARRTHLRPKDYLDLLVLKYMYFRQAETIQDFEHDLEKLDQSKLSRFEKIKLELLFCLILNDEQSRQTIEAKCLEDHSYSLLGHISVSAGNLLEIYPTSRKIRFPNGLEKAYRSNSKTFDLLLSLISHPKESMTKSELFAKVWGRTMTTKDDENIFYVNMANLKKIVGHDRIQLQGSCYSWNKNLPYVLKLGL